MFFAMKYSIVRLLMLRYFFKLSLMVKLLDLLNICGYVCRFILEFFIRILMMMKIRRSKIIDYLIAEKMKKIIY